MQDSLAFSSACTAAIFAAAIVTPAIPMRNRAGLNPYMRSPSSPVITPAHLLKLLAGSLCFSQQASSWPANLFRLAGLCLLRQTVPLTFRHSLLKSSQYLTSSARTQECLNTSIGTISRNWARRMKSNLS